MFAFAVFLKVPTSDRTATTLSTETWGFFVLLPSALQPHFLPFHYQTYLLTYLLTPWSRVLLEKLTGSQQVKKFPAFYGTRRFFTVFTSPRHLSLSWASSIQSIPPHPTSWRSILILSSHLRLGLPSTIPCGAKRTHVFQLIVTLFIFNIKELC